jgi:predicted tellurium resistance membrane protein TerC
MMEWISQPQAWVALATLTALEIVLGIDNIVFISVLVGRLPEEYRNKARTIGLALAMIMRILLLLTLTWIMTLVTPVFTVFKNEISGRDIILLAGGLFLLAKSTHEIHQSLEGQPESAKRKLAGSFASILIQIAVLDIVFSLDSVITAVGLADDIPVMVLAIVIAVGVMMLSARVIGDFVDGHPTIKMLALSFLLLVGFSLMGEGLDLHIPKGYIYFAMAFSLGVELLNLRVRDRAKKPLKLHKPLED